MDRENDGGGTVNNCSLFVVAPWSGKEIPATYSRGKVSCVACVVPTSARLILRYPSGLKRSATKLEKKIRRARYRNLKIVRLRQKQQRTNQESKRG